MTFTHIHKRALAAARKLRVAEAEMIDVLQAIDDCCGYRELGYSSLTAYMIGELNFSEAGAHHFITVCRKAKKIPELQAAIKRDEITISKAKTIVPVLNNENAFQWLQMAKKSTVRELERQVAQEIPEVKRIERIRHKAKDQVEVTVTVSQATIELLQRAQEVLRQKHRTPVKMAETLHEVMNQFLERNDPLRKIARKKPTALSDREKAMLRDEGRCQFKTQTGKLCGSRYWLDMHHITPKSEGGLDTVENLITLCSGHHRLIHDPPPLT